MQSKHPTPAYRKRLGEVIRLCRKARGLSQEKLAELADVHRNYIGLVERGEQNLTVDSLVNIVRALKYKVLFLVKDAGL